MKKYLLSTGVVTNSVSKYVIDLIKLNLMTYPGDLPGVNVGFDFLITDTLINDLPSVVKQKAESLISRIKNNFGSGITIELSSVEIIDAEKVKMTISVNQTSETIEINIQNNS
jgi:hypothetical protein